MDNIGGLVYKKWLGEVTSKLTILGRSNLAVIPESIEIRNFGMLNPVNDNTTFDKSPRNRRVDVIFWP